MKKKIFKNIILKELKYNDVSKSYVSWLNDKVTNRFTEQRFIKHNVKTTKNYIAKQRTSKNNYLYGIFLKLEKKKIHIGNLKIGSINFKHKFAEISYLIGNKSYLNYGIGTLAVKKGIKLCKSKFKIKKLIAGCYSINHASKKVLLKNGFKLEGIITKKLTYKTKRIDHCIYGLNIK